MNGLLMIKSGKQIRKLSSKIILKRREQKHNKKKMINTQSMKEWIMPPYSHIKKQLNSKLFRKFRWGNTFLKLGITRLILFTIIMEIVCTFVNFAWLFLICPNN